MSGMSFGDWLTCPFCPDEREEVSLRVDGEHVLVSCDHCESVVKLYHGGLPMEMVGWD